MYCKYYQLKEKPFQITTDPRFLWLGEKHKEALSILKYGILDNKWFLLLTGDVGTGKTTLINALLRSLDARVIVAAIPDPGLEELDLFNYIADAFKMEKVFASKGAFLIHFKRFLNDAHDNQKKVLLIIDEAQQLTQERLETIRLLSNIEREETKLINIFFVGQHEFNDILRRAENRALRQRITINYNIAPLTLAETAAYITHRLKIAKAAKPMFTPKAVSRIAVHSGGYPRRINILCDYALVTGYVKGVSQIGADIISECANELKIPGHKPVLQQDFADAPQQIVQPEPGTVTPAVQPAAEAYRHSKAGAAPNALPPTKPKQPVLLFGLLGILLVAGVLLFGYYSGWHLSHRQVPVPEKPPAAQTRKSSPAPGVQPQSGRSAKLPEVHLPTVTVPAVKGSRTADDRLGSTQPAVSSRQDSGQKSAARGNPTGGAAPGPAITTVTNGPKSPADTIAGLKFSRQPADSSGQPTLLSRLQPLAPVAPAEQKTAGVQVDDTLEKRIQELVRKKKMVVYFGYDSNDMKAKTLKSLDTISVFMQRYPQAKVIIRGYTDSSGVYSYNKKLSEFRANMVKSYLVGKGADPAKIKTRGMGPENPVQSNRFEKTRKFNRRVEIEIFPTPSAKRISRIRQTARPAVSAPY